MIRGTVHVYNWGAFWLELFIKCVTTVVCKYCGNNTFDKYNECNRQFIPLFVGSKTPTSKFGWNKEVRWELCCP
ncbi:hypothetical protein, partial [Bacillus sp. SRB_8]|uniref:hypothetical protein n=1 Tax=Bacillus TaxID=1386 RepID=UPI00283A8E2B